MATFFKNASGDRAEMDNDVLFINSSYGRFDVSLTNFPMPAQVSNFTLTGTDEYIVVAYEGYRSNSEGSSSSEIFARLYDWQGQPLTGDITLSDQVTAGYLPSIAPLGDGRLVSIWQTDGVPGTLASFNNARYTAGRLIEFSNLDGLKAYETFIVGGPSPSATTPLPITVSAGSVSLRWDLNGDGIAAEQVTIDSFIQNSVPSASIEVITYQGNSAGGVDPTVHFDVESSFVNEGDLGSRFVSVGVSLSTAVERDLYIPLEILGSATPEVDFFGTSSSVFVSAGETSGQVSFQIKGDSIAEGQETVILQLQATDGYVLGSQSTHTLTIGEGTLEFQPFQVLLGPGTDSSAANTAFAYVIPTQKEGEYKVSRVMSMDAETLGDGTMWGGMLVEAGQPAGGIWVETSTTGTFRGISAAEGMIYNAGSDVFLSPQSGSLFLGDIPGTDFKLNLINPVQNGEVTFYIADLNASGSIWDFFGSPSDIVGHDVLDVWLAQDSSSLGFGDAPSDEGVAETNAYDINSRSTFAVANGSLYQLILPTQSEWADLINATQGPPTGWQTHHYWLADSYGNADMHELGDARLQYLMDTAPSEDSENGFLALQVNPVSLEVSATKSQVIEGEEISFVINTSGIAAGTELAYALSGITQDDLGAGEVMSGKFTVGSSGQEVLSFWSSRDGVSEGTESVALTVEGGDWTASHAISLNDRVERFSNGFIISEVASLDATLSELGFSMDSDLWGFRTARLGDDKLAVVWQAQNTTASIPSEDLSYAVIELSSGSIQTTGVMEQPYAQGQISLASVDQKVFVTYASQPAGYHADEWGFFLSSDGSVSTPSMLMDGWSGADWEPNIARLETGEFLMTFSSERSYPFSVYGQKISSDGSPIGNAFLISDNGPGREMTLVEDLLAVVPGTISAGENLFLAGWKDLDGSSVTKIGLLDADLGTRLDVEVVSSDAASRARSLVLNSSGEGVVVYTANGDAFVRSISVTGTEITLGDELSLRLDGISGQFVDASAVVVGNNQIGINLVSYESGVQTIQYLQLDAHKLANVNLSNGSFLSESSALLGSVLVDQVEIPDLNQTFFIDSDIVSRDETNSVVLSYKGSDTIKLTEVQWINSPTPPAPIGVSPSGGGFLELSSELQSDYQYGQVPYVYVPNSASLDITGEISVSTWLYRSAAADPMMSDWANVYDKPFAHLLEFAPSGGFDFRAENENMDFNANGPVVPTGQWAHVVAVSRQYGEEDYRFEIFVDGVLANDANAWQIESINNTSGVRSSDFGYYLGILASQDPYNLDPWQGALDDFQIWSKALTADEINQQYLGNFNYTDQNNLVLRFEFDDSAGQLVSDSSGYNNNGMRFVSEPGQVYLSPYSSSLAPEIDIRLASVVEGKVHLELWIDPNRSLDSILLKLSPEPGFSVDIEQALQWDGSQWTGGLGQEAEGDYFLGGYSLTPLLDENTLQRLVTFEVDRSVMTDPVLTVDLTNLVLNEDLSLVENVYQFNLRLASNVSIELVSEGGIDPWTISEASGDGTLGRFAFDLVLEDSLLTTETVNWRLERLDGSSAAEDFASTIEGQVTFEAGATRVRIELDALNDDRVELDEQFRLRLTSGSGGVILGPETLSDAVTVLDDDKAIVSIHTHKSALTEGDSGSVNVHRFEVRLDQAAVDAQTVNWTVVGLGDRPAEAADFDFGGLMPTGTLTFEAGEISKFIDIGVVGDGLSERHEKFAVVLEDPELIQGAAGGVNRLMLSSTNASAEGLILDDDGAPLGGLVYHWKSHALLSDVQISAKSVGAAPEGDKLYEMRNTQISSDGTMSAEIWVNLDTNSVENLDLELAFEGRPDVTFTANPDISNWTLLWGTNALSQDDTLVVQLAGLASSESSTLTGSVKLGSLRVELPEGQQLQEVGFVSGSVGDVVSASYEQLAAYAMRFESFVDVTNTDGSYEIAAMPLGLYEVDAFRALTSYETGNAITSADALAALKLAVGRNPNSDGSVVSPYQFISADVNNSGTVTSADALSILKMAVRRYDAPAREWLFVDESYDFWDEDAQAFTTKRNDVPTEEALKVIANTMESEELNLVAMLRGDVNGSWVAAEGGLKLDPSYFLGNPAGISIDAASYQFVV